MSAELPNDADTSSHRRAEGRPGEALRAIGPLIAPPAHSPNHPDIMLSAALCEKIGQSQERNPAHEFHSCQCRLGGNPRSRYRPWNRQLKRGFPPRPRPRRQRAQPDGHVLGQGSEHRRRRAPLSWQTRSTRHRIDDLTFGPRHPGSHRKPHGESGRHRRLGPDCHAVWSVPIYARPRWQLHRPV